MESNRCPNGGSAAYRLTELSSKRVSGNAGDVEAHQHLGDNWNDPSVLRVSSNFQTDGTISPAASKYFAPPRITSPNSDPTSIHATASVQPLPSQPRRHPQLATCILTKAHSLNPVPTSYDDALPEDRALLAMVSEDVSPATMAKVYNELCDTSLTAVDIQVRIQLMQTNFRAIHVDQTEALIRIVQEVEQEFAMNKWEMVAQKLDAETGDYHPAEYLEAVYKGLSERRRKRVPAK